MFNPLNILYMKTTFRFACAALFWVLLSSRALAFNYNPTNHIQVYYDYCEEDVVVDFVYFQSAGDNDKMDFLYFKHKPSSGAPITIIDFRHESQFGQETGWNILVDSLSPQNQFGFKTYTSNGYNWQIIYDSQWEQIDQEGHKFWVRFRLRDLPESLIETFTCSGHWDGNGSGSPSLDINTTHTLSLYVPDTPTGMTASQGACSAINLSWTFSDFEPCPNKAYYFRLYRDNSNTHFVEIPATTSNTIHTYSDPQPPTGTTPQNHSYRVRVVMKQGNTVFQYSALSGQATGYSLPLPASNTNLAITYNGCAGNYTVNWQNPQIYSSIEVTRTPSSGSPVTDVISGTATAFSSTINSGILYTISVVGVDACAQRSQAVTLNNVQVPQGPGPFTQNAPAISNGSYLISWTASQGATGYTITRIGPAGNTDIVLDDASATSYLDADVQVCTQYSYRVKARNTCGNVTSATLPAPVIPAALNIWTNQKLTCSKGYYGNRVVLEWQEPTSYGFDHFKIFRKPLGTNDADTYVGSVLKTELSFTDLYAQAGVLYEYKLVAYSDCNGDINAADPLVDVGFRLPIATVAGNVKFETGTGVADVAITVERNEGSLGKSLHFNGLGQLTIDPNYAAAPLTTLELNQQMTIELWIKPESTNTSFTVFEQRNGNKGYGLKYDANANVWIQYIINNGTTTSTSFPASLDLEYFTHISWRRDASVLSLFINGEPQTSSASGYTASASNVALTFGSGFSGHLDEIRWWNIARADEDINLDYHQILRGDEDGLNAYWRIDEGVGSDVYDISGSNEDFNAHHLSRNAHVTWEAVYPLPSQLGNVARTDSVGNYIIKNIRYTNTGSTFTVIPFFSPGNTPHAFDPATTVLFMGEGNDIQNNVNFVDQSSFKVTGRITYSLPDSICPSSKAFIYVDDKVATNGGQPVFANADGDFEISVPIGLHQISIVQNGHVFHNNGLFPPDGSLYDFQEDVSGLEFFDSTRVRVMGRVVGGTREGDKRLGYGDSKNNIGKAILTFTPQAFICASFTVETDSASGEYAVDLLPLKYDVSISIPSNPGLSFGPQDVIDLTVIRPTAYVLDSIRNFAGQLIDIDSVPYNLQKNFIYRSVPDLDLTDAATGGPLRGDSVYVYVDGVDGDTILVPLQNMPYPVFFSGKKYKSIISVFEPYFNYDNPNAVVEDHVPVTDATVTIRNRMGNASGTGPTFDEKFEINNPEGMTEYTFFGGQPEFFIDPDPNSNRSFTQVLEMFLETPQHVVTWMPNGELFRGYVLGSNPVEGSSFVTEGPEMVDYVLRDPPGDASSASFVQGETYTNTYSWFTNTKTTIETDLKLKLGMAYFFGGGMLGIGFDTKADNDNNLKISSSASINVDGEYTESTTFEQSISTSTDPYFPGDESDIFMGKSMNYLFGTSDELTLVNTETCNLMDACVGPEIMVNGASYRLAKRKGVFMVPQGFKTTFVYSQWQIENYLIPNLVRLRNNLFVNQPNKYVITSGLSPEDEGFALNNDDPFWANAVTSDDPFTTVVADYTGPSYTYNALLDAKPDDRVRWYNQQIRLWTNALARNEEEKVKAVLARNISFDAGASLSYSQSSSNASRYSEKIEISIGTNASLFFGALFAGSGFEQTFTLGFEVVTGSGFSQESESTNTYGFTLADSQPGDFFSVDVKDGNLGNGPIFSLRGGQSMCPWEREYVTKYYQPGTSLSISTIRRELPQLEVEPSFAANVPAHQPARFKVRMTNASPTGDIQWYRLKLLEDTNPNGALLTVDNGANAVDQVFEIPAGKTIEKTLSMFKDEEDFYEMKVVLFSECEYAAFQNGAPIYAIDTITISAQFVPACSDVNILTPVDLWVHHDADMNLMDIVISDYTLEDNNLEKLQLQYKPSYTSVWKGIESFWVNPPQGSGDPQIPPGSSLLDYTWNLEQLPDGPYDIRVVSHCTNTDNDYASPQVSGIVDRVRPHAFGNPQPADGVLDPNDEIMIQFNEPINPASIISSNFDVQAVLNGAPLRHETSIQLDGINDYVEIPQGTRIGNESFTIELWLKRLSNGDKIIWSQGEKVDSSMALGFNSSNKLYFRMLNQTVLSNATITADNQWYHIAVTCNANRQVNFYVTGVHYPGATLTTLPSIQGNMVFGKAAWNESAFFHGYIHEVRIWRTELTEGAIRSQMLKKLSGVEAGLSMLWPMDEGMGSQLYERVRKKHATLYGDWAILPSGKSLVFGGNYLIDADAGTMVFSRQHSFTLEFWMKGMKNGSYQTLLSNGKGNGEDTNTAGWCISADASGQLIIDHGGQQFVVIEKDVLNNNWHHVAIALNRQGNLNTYLDGLLQTSLFGDAFGEFGGPSLWIGKRGWYDGVTEMHDRPFTGSMDEIRVWNTRLTPEHIRALINNRLSGSEFGLQLYLPFETYSETGGIPQLTASTSDQSPEARELTLSGPPQYQEDDPNIRLVAPFEKVNFTYAINGDKIIITPTTDPLRIERTQLFISLDRVEDLYGNRMAGPVNWTAFVNRNQLQWEEDELFFEKPEKVSMEFTSTIANSGGTELSFEILGLPDWLTASPASGTISAVSTRTIHFEISEHARIGDYSTDINLISGQGYNDKLSLNLHVFGVPPSWTFNPNAFSNSMSVVADLDIKGELSEDELDRVVAYVNGDVRGLATLEYIPELDRYMAFMQVYSNATSGENVTFKAWDASTGTTYAGVQIKVGAQTNLQIPFVANSLVGTVVTPARWIVTNDIIQEIPLNAGWTWISFNVLSSQFGNLNTFFSELNFENNDLVQSQTKSAAYNPSTGWQGNLVAQGLEIKKMYQTRFTYQDVLRVSGPRVNPDLYPVSIVTGQNWIPMLSSERIEINEALSSFAAVSGDWIKSQNQLSVYHPTQGWVGTLQYMEPGKGYILYSSHAGSIVYPFVAQPHQSTEVMENVLIEELHWRSGTTPEYILPQEKNMTLVAVLDSPMALGSAPVIAAYASGQLLDLAEGMALDEGGLRYYYFTLQGQADLGQIYFEVYNEQGDYAGLAEEQISWTAHQMIGSHEDPFVLHLTQAPDTHLELYPNPFDRMMQVTFETDASGQADLRIYDVQGQPVYRSQQYLTKPGKQFMQWSGHGMSGDLVASGTYFVEVVFGQTVFRGKVIKL